MHWKVTYSHLDELLKLRLSDTMSKELEELLKTPTAAQRRIMKWHKRLGEAEAKAVLFERQLERLKDTNQLNQSNAQYYEQKVEELHDQLLFIQNDQDARQLAWEQQQTEFEKMIAQYEEERDRLYLSTTAAELKDTLPDRSLPVGEQLEQALRKLIERTRQINFLNMKNEDLESKLKCQLDSIQQTNQALNDTTYRMKKLEVELKRVRTASVASNTTEVNAQDDGFHSDRSRIREANALRAAHETMVSLQKQLKQKDEMVEKYRSMLQSVRSELTAKTLENDAIDQKNKELNSMLQREIDRYQKSEEQKAEPAAREMYPSINSSIAEVEMISELQNLLNVKEQLVTELEEKLKVTLEKNRAQEEEKLERMRLLEEENQRLTTQIANMKAIEQQLSLEIERARDLLAVPPVKDLSDVVHRLQGEIDQRDSKISTMTKAIQKLKSQLVLLSKELAESKINANAGNLYTEEMVQQRIMPLTKKITQLESKLKKFSGSAERDRTEYLKFEQDIQRMTDELVLKNQEINRLKSEVQDMVAKATKVPSAATGKSLPAHSRLTSWESEKNLNKKLEQLKEKLKQKTSEAEQLHKTVSISKDAYDRSEKDRLKLQTRLAKATKELTEKQLEHEKEIKRLQNQNASLQVTLSKAPKGTKSSESLNHPPLPFVDSDMEILRQKTPEELMEVVAKLTTLVSKLKSKDAVKLLRKEIEVQKATIDELQSQILNYKKLETENTHLRQSLRKETEKLKSLQSKLDEAKLSNETMVKDIVHLRKVIAQVEPESGKSVMQLTEEIHQLQQAIKEKERVIDEFMNPDNNETSRLHNENRKIKRENEMLQIRVAKLTEETSKSNFTYKMELDALKKEHTMCQQKIEDLTYNYKEAVKQNLLLSQAQ
jgi:CAP-Gly domain-containing linker protein 1